jgi:predicted nucleotidyltransferase
VSDANTELLARMAEALGLLRERMAFIGGCATALLVTDPAAAPVRATQDVDAIVAVASDQEYRLLGKALRERGFRQTVEEGQPPYRWSFGGMLLDVMPTDEGVLGFSNRWYGMALRSATSVDLRPGLSIRLVEPTCFVATKLTAFEDRGRSDYLESHDLEDVLSVVDGRPAIVAELAAADSDLRTYVRTVFARLLADDGFINALPGLLLDGSPATRTPAVLQRLKLIAADRPA